MADDSDSLLFLDFLDDILDRSERIVLPMVNPFEDYDEKKFRERFRLSKRVALHLLTEVGKGPHSYDNYRTDSAQNTVLPCTKVQNNLIK